MMEKNIRRRADGARVHALTQKAWLKNAHGVLARCSFFWRGARNSY